VAQSAINLLNDLNGNKNGLLNEFIKNCKADPRIAWYPSSGTDFRGLMYLSAEYERIKPSSKAAPVPPDFFLFTDYFPWEGSTFLDSKEVFNDGHTHITVEEFEKLPSLNLSYHYPEIVEFKSKIYNTCVFLKIKIESDKLGVIRYPVLYAFVENEAFFMEKLLPLKAKITHIIHVRYGGDCGGGGHASGIWLLNVLKTLGTELFISDTSIFGDYWAGGDAAFLKYCPSVNKEDKPKLTKIKTIPSESWSDYGDVGFNLVQA